MSVVVGGVGCLPEHVLGRLVWGMREDEGRETYDAVDLVHEFR